MFFLYVDYTTENPPRPFYVGKGCKGRVRSLKRNRHHSFVVKHLGLRREIVMCTSVESIVLTQEARLIEELNTYNPSFKATLDDIRCNKTKGGEGVSGWKHTAEWKVQQSKRMSGENHPGYNKPGNRLGMHNSAEMRKKQSEAVLGTKHPNFGKPAWNKGLQMSSEAVANNRAAQLKRYAEHSDTPEIRQRKSDAQRKRWERIRAQRGTK